MADVAAALRSWSVTPGSNSPTTSTVVGAGLSGNLQQIQATTRQYLASIGSSVICSATTDLSTVDGFTIPISGNSTITSFGTEQAGISYRLQFSGTPTLKNSTAIQTPSPTSGDMSIASGEIVEVVSQGSGNWKVSNWFTQNPRFNTVNASAITGTTSVVTPLVKQSVTNAALILTGGTAANTDCSIQMLGSTNAGTPNQIFYEASSHNFTDAIGNTTWIKVPGVGNIQLGAASVLSGVGIAFPSNQSASTDANTLDDYEEGTWTPSVGGTATYTAQIGTYVKIGGIVFLRGVLTINAIGTGSTTTISGLPFTSANNGNISGCVSSFGSLAVSPVFLACNISGASTTMAFPGLTAAAASTSALAIFGNSASVTFSIAYPV